MIDGHGDDLFRYGDKIKVNFSTNIPQNVDHTALLNHLAEVGAIFKNYPEPEPRSVERKLAKLHGANTENIIVTNGATEAIYLLAHAFAGGQSAILSPTFREYQDACGIFDHSVQFVTTLNDISGTPDTVWLCNPNNPTGKVYDRNNLLAVIDNHPMTVFVVDQAYASYTVRDVISVSDAIIRKNVVMLHSMTKQFTVPGLRIGYAIGPEPIIRRLRSLKMPWSVNSIAIEAAHFLLNNASDYMHDAGALYNEAKRLSEKLRESGLTVEDTDCNFLLALLPYGAASELKTWLIDNHGLLIRDASNFEGLTLRHFRIAVQDSNENNLLVKAIKEWISLYQ